MKNLEALACNVWPILTSQTQPLSQKRNGPVNCVYRSCSTGMQLDRWRIQVWQNTLSNIPAKCEHFLKSIINMLYSSCSSEKDVLDLCHFQSKLLLQLKHCNESCARVYCSMTEPHCIMQWIWLVYTAHHADPSFLLQKCMVLAHKATVEPL